MAVVAVTGASGFVAGHVVRQLLEDGHIVRGTVRSPDDRDRHAWLLALPGAGERLTLHGADLMEPGSFDEAIAGCRYVQHIASPYALNVDDPQRDLVDPAVDGTRNVMAAAERAGTVERVVLTSSVAAVSDHPVDRALTEEDWNDESSLTRNPYYFSKVQAERAAWSAAEDAPFELVVVNPFVVIGPSLSGGINESTDIVRQLLDGDIPAVVDLTWGFVDVRDVALAHVAAMVRPDAEGRHLVAAEARTQQQVVDLLRAHGYGGTKLPRIRLTGRLATSVVRWAARFQPPGTRSYLETNLGTPWRFDNRKSIAALGIDYRDVDQSIIDTADDLVRHGLTDATAPG